ncbi:glycosyltransferase [Methylobacterium planeticum]|uniref:Glycosyltransferase family 4 protein n=1 Tax=Methylobacterium planeticum TaxID=2615211 RepID=A0A6N6MNS2_9HYPH|nr:glycosyltransferase [Methylobacterium planeticum]KAB1070761.1 glycosyltransferase family 4 protein [Methylobacterium planeticum]
MKLLLLLSTLGSGGAERVMTLLANHWVAEGHLVTLVTTFGRYVEPAFALSPEVTVRSLDGGPGEVERGRIRRLLALRQIMLDSDFDGAIAFLSNVNLAAILARIGLAIPLVVSERTYPPACPLTPTFEFARRGLYRFADVVVMQTDDGARWLAEQLPSARGCVIPNPVLWPIPSAMPVVSPTAIVPADRRLLLSVGRLSPEKRFDLLLEAFARAGDVARGWHLVIAGEGPSRAMLEADTRRLGIEDRVSLPGQIGNMAEWFGLAEAFALTSSFEGYPNALLEAVASGVPVAAIDCPTGVRHLVARGVNGVLAPRNTDAACFASALRTLLGGSWPGAASTAVEARERHAIARIADQWLSCLRGVAA